MALVGVELEMLVNEQDALTNRPPPCASSTITKKILLNSALLPSS